MNYLKDELSGFIPEEQAHEILTDIVRGASVLRLSHIEPMTSEKKKFNVLVDGPGAYWIGEGERIKTSGATWIHPEITAKKLAVIIPVTKEKLCDSINDVFTDLTPQITEAFHQTIDRACIFGENSPFDTSIIGSITDTNMTVTADSSLDLAVSDTMAMVEAGGYEVNGFAGHIGIKNMLRKLRDSSGAPIYIEGTNTKELYSQPVEFVRGAAWNSDKADLIGGEWKYSVVGIRSGIEFEVLTEATLQGTLDADGKPISLAEQDMIAIKATMRLGYLVIKDDAFAAFKYAAPTLGGLTVTSTAGSESGYTKLSVTPAAALGNTFVYQQGSADVSLGDDLSDWDALDDELEAVGGSTLTVAEIDSEGNALRCGSVTVVTA